MDLPGNSTLHRRIAQTARGTRLLQHFATILAVAAGIATAGAAWAQPAQDDLPGRVGRVADLGGELFIAPQDKPDGWQSVGVNYPVASGDNLWVGTDGRAEIDFGAGQFRLAGDSNIHLSRLDDRQFAVFVAQGRVQLRVRVLDPGETARVDTPNAQVVLTRAGSYRVDVSPDRQHTIVVVREGEANVLTMGAVQQVLPGQSAFVDGPDPQLADVRNGVGMDAFDTWAANRDRLYLRGQYSSYVSPQMVGAADLDQYGTWSQVPEYGAVWYPTDVAPDWAPYRNGYWTDVGAWGPTWVDAAPWGYAPFHYGRWAFIGGRWGWAPGRYVARPLWAPALVAWTGGPGWSFSVSTGGPVYGWVPLGWAEPYRPWWNRCSFGCWDRYNKPYAVNTAVYHQNSPPPNRYVNWNAPGGVTAVAGNSLVYNRPIQQSLVRVPREAMTSAPVLATAPMVRAEPARIPTARPAQGVPPPASTFYPTSRPAYGVPAGTPPGNRTQRNVESVPATTPGGRPTYGTPAPTATPPSGTMTRPSSGTSPVNPPSSGTMTRPSSGAPTVNPPSSGTMTRPSSGTPSPAAQPANVTPPYGSTMQRPAAGTAPVAPPPGSNAPLSRSPSPSLSPAPSQPQDVRPGRAPQQPAAPSSQGTPMTQSAPAMRPVPQPTPSLRPMPQPVPQQAAPSVQAPLSRSPAPSVAPAPQPQPQSQSQSRSAPAAAAPAGSSDGNVRREGRGGGDGQQGQDRPGR